MNWQIPGTILEVPMEEVQYIPEQFQSMFLPGGMVLSQVAGVTGLEPHTIQNWVKRGFLPPPINKRYTLEQLCRIVNIHMLRGILPMERICSLLGYVNGRLDDEGDDIIDDSQLYFLFVRLAAQASSLGGPETWESVLESSLAQYAEPVPGAKDRVKKALRIMLTAWGAAKLRQQAENLLQQLEI